MTLFNALNPGSVVISIYGVYFLVQSLKNDNELKYFNGFVYDNFEHDLYFCDQLIFAKLQINSTEKYIKILNL